MSSRQSAVGNDQSVKMVEIVDENADANETSPILTKERNVFQVYGFHEAVHCINVKLVRVIVTQGQLVGLSKADQVGGDTPVTCCDEGRDHLSIKVGPGRFAVHQ